MSNVWSQEFFAAPVLAASREHAVDLLASRQWLEVDDRQASQLTGTDLRGWALMAPTCRLYLIRAAYITMTNGPHGGNLYTSKSSEGDVDVVYADRAWWPSGKWPIVVPLSSPPRSISVSVDRSLFVEGSFAIQLPGD